MKNTELHTKANEVLNDTSKGKLKRVYITLEHFPFFNHFSHGSKVGNYIYGGSNDNGQQVWLLNQLT